MIKGLLYFCPMVKSILAIAMFFITLGLGLNSCGEKKQTVQKPKTETKDSTNEDQLLTELNKKLVNDPNNASLYHDRSLYFLNHGVYNKAMDDIVRALSIDSMNAEYVYTKGDIFFGALKYEQAMAEFSKCLKLDKTHSLANIKMARLLIYLRQYKESMAHIDLALKSDVNLAEAYFLKGVIFQYMGDSAKAASSFQTAVEQKSDYYDAYITLGLLCAMKHDSAAVQYYESALTLRNNSIEALYNMAIYYQDHGKYNNAFEIYNKILKIQPSTANAYHNKGYIHLVYLNELDKALVQFDSALYVNPKYIEAYHNRGLTYREMKKFKEARADYKMALQLDPQYDLSAKELQDMDKQGER